MLDAAKTSGLPLGETAALPSTWTPGHVGLRLVEAMRTLDRLPRPKGPRAPGNHWPQHRLEEEDQIAQAELPESERRERAGARLAVMASRPDGAAIDRMNRALEWLRLLRAHDPGLALIATLWAHRSAKGRSLRALCRERGWTPQTFHSRKTKALLYITAALETRGEPLF